MAAIASWLGCSATFPSSRRQWSDRTNPRGCNPIPAAFGGEDVTVTDQPAEPAPHRARRHANLIRQLSAGRAHAPCEHLEDRLIRSHAGGQGQAPAAWAPGGCQQPQPTAADLDGLVARTGCEAAWLVAIPPALDRRPAWAGVGHNEPECWAAQAAGWIIARRSGQPSAWDDSQASFACRCLVACTERTGHVLGQQAAPTSQRHRQ